MQLGSALRAGRSSEVIAIVPHDVNVLPKAVSRIRATGAGNITFVSGDGTDDVIAVLAGETVDIRTQHVKATGTTATGLQGIV
jgi:hypothetical protein